MPHSVRLAEIADLILLEIATLRPAVKAGGELNFVPIQKQLSKKKISERDFILAARRLGTLGCIENGDHMPWRLTSKGYHWIVKLRRLQT